MTLANFVCMFMQGISVQYTNEHKLVEIWSRKTKQYNYSFIFTFKFT